MVNSDNRSLITENPCGSEGPCGRVSGGRLVTRKLWWRLRSLVKEAPHLRTGRRGESQAEDFLRRNGYRLIARNVRVGRDELDLIVRQNETLVFVEVKTRKNERFGRPVSAVDRHKRRKISRAAIRFLKKRRLRPPYIRFDVIEVVGEEPQIRHLQNVFTLEGGFRIWW